MRTAVVLLVASVLMVLAITANAATIYNNDKGVLALRVVESGDEQQVELRPGFEVTNICKSKCDLYIGNDPDPYEIGSIDMLVIEGGKLYEVDSSPTPSTPSQ